MSTGQRGIKALFVQDELLRSCLALSHACSVAITTGFPTHYMHRYLHIRDILFLFLLLSAKSQSCMSLVPTQSGTSD